MTPPSTLLMIQKPCILVLELERMARQTSYFGEAFDSLGCITGGECANLARAGTGHLLVVKFDTCFEEALAECTAWLSNPLAAHIPCVLWGTEFRLEQRIAALRSGVHDVFIGPQLSDEELARLDNLLKRRPGIYSTGTGRLLRSGDIELDVDAYRVRIGTDVLRLTPRQTAVLQVLMERPGIAITLEEVAQRVWQGGNVDLSTVRYCVNALGRRLALRSRLNPIRNLRGLGYAFDAVST